MVDRLNNRRYIFMVGGSELITEPDHNPLTMCTSETRKEGTI
jgi:hypothetical protein